MGGQHSYFGLWIDADFGKGHSKAKPTCTTYNSPQLSATENFQFQKMEVWAVGDAAGTQLVSWEGHLLASPLLLLLLQVICSNLFLAAVAGHGELVRAQQSWESCRGERV